MSIKAQCYNCSSRFSAPASLAGKLVKCPTCKTAIRIPIVGADPTPAADPLPESPDPPPVFAELFSSAPPAAANPPPIPLFTPPPDPSPIPWLKSKDLGGRFRSNTPSFDVLGFLSGHKLVLSIVAFASFLLLTGFSGAAPFRPEVAVAIGLAGYAFAAGAWKSQHEEEHGSRLSADNWRWLEEGIGKVFFGIYALLVIVNIGLIVYGIVIRWSEITWNAYFFGFLIGVVVSFFVLIAICMIGLSLSERFGFFKMISWVYLILMLCGSAFLLSANAARDQLIALREYTRAPIPNRLRGDTAPQLQRLYEEDLQVRAEIIKALSQAHDLQSRLKAAAEEANLRLKLQEISLQIAHARLGFGAQQAGDRDSSAFRSYEDRKSTMEQSIASEWRRINTQLGQNRVVPTNPPQALDTTPGQSATNAPPTAADDPRISFPPPGFSHRPGFSERHIPPRPMLPEQLRQPEAATHPVPPEFPANPGLRPPLPGDFPESRLPPRALELDERINHEFIFGSPSASLDFIRAKTLIEEPEKFLSVVRWSPGLDRVASSLIWGFTAEPVGLGGATVPSNLRPAEAPQIARSRRRPPDQHRLADQLALLTGDSGKWMTQGLQSRVDNGEFGEWQQEVERHDHDARGLMLMPTGDQDHVLADARREGIDLLVTAILERKSSEPKSTSKMFFRIHDVENKKMLWESKPITDAQVAAGRRRGKDPAAELVEGGLEYIDKNLILQTPPEITSEKAHARLAQVAVPRRPSALADLIELRYFQLRKLITDDEATAACVKILGEEEGKLFVTGDRDARLRAIAKLLPQE